MKIDKSAIKPYGDTLNDGKVQLSFTLPVPAGPEAKEAAKQLVAAMGVEESQVVEMKVLDKNFSFFILYGNVEHSVDMTEISVAKVNTAVMEFEEINKYIRDNIGREITVVGACTGSDAHTVGLDAIINMKGYAGEYGLERYPEIKAYNLGSQIPNEELIAKALEVRADAILVSQVVTQKGVHVQNLTELVEILEAENLREEFLLIVGGPRISHELALELGFDAGFGPGTLPPEVASFIVQTLVEEERI